MLWTGAKSCQSTSPPKLRRDTRSATFGHRKTNLPPSVNLPNLVGVNDSHQSCADDACPQADLCPLASVKAGTAVRIKQLSAAPEVSHRLREMGFCEEQQVRVVSKHVNVICQVCHARLGLSQQLAESILVQPLPKNLKLDVA